jgi:glucose/arabinose dehydrogenase
VKLVDPKIGVQKTPYLDIRKQVNFGGECGLLSIAFHPEFASNGLLYVNYTSKGKLQTVISEFRAQRNARAIDPATERVILRIDQPFSNHNGGQIAFGPDGMLYIGMGDGGSANDPQENGQNPRTLLGKILRIDVSPRRGYAVPKDNPFVKDDRFAPEIWALGLRNPWRFSFDRVTGDCYTGDVGQNTYEEVDLLVAGANYGWNEREGFHPFQRGRNSPEFVDPLAEYGRDKGLSVTGGYVYRGKMFPALDGVYLYADYGTGRFWGLRQSKGIVTANAELIVTRQGKPILNRVQPSSFGEDAAGEMYVCDHNGVVYRIVKRENVKR